MPKPGSSQLLSIGALADRSGLSVSAIRFYEDKGLISAVRNAGGHRRFARADLRRLSFILIVQQLGFSLEEIKAMLDALPRGRNPGKSDWQRIGSDIRRALDLRIGMLERLRDRLSGCSGCGCLSLDVCALYNPDDHIASQGAGPRYVINAGP